MRKILMILFIASLSSCIDRQTAVVDKKELFRLELGKAEDQIDLVQLPGIPFRERTRIVMKNGLFYISNGNTDKIMEFNSYGDIITLFYNPDENPPPLLLETGDNEGTVSNRRAFEYPFNNIGEIEVTPDGTLLVDDEVSENRVEYDKETGSVLNRIVLLFSRDGKLYGYLGQEGLGGTPFPYIEKLEVNNSGDIVVFSRTMKSRIVYWFTDDGTLLYTITFPLESLPVPEGSDYIPFLDTMDISKTARTVFLKIDYYRETVSEGASSVGSDGGYAESVVWKFSVPDKRYTGSIIIPSLNGDSAGNRNVKNYNDDVYEFLGSDKSGKLYFLVHLQSDMFQLLILSYDGTVIAKSSLEMDDKDISYSSFYLSDNGLLTALLAKESYIDIVWWRSDKIKGEGDDWDH